MQNYVLITPAHNEALFIEKTFQSVCSQTRPPLRWIVVNDASTDQTAAILERCKSQRPDLLDVVLLQRSAGRDFGNKVRAFNAGLARASDLGYSFIGNVDADISFPPDYYKQILAEFEDDSELGLAGGMVSSCIDGEYVSQNVAQDSVAGAVQLFRRECFEGIGGYLVLPNGGIDAAAEIMARKCGWKVRTFSRLQVLEHRRTGTATTSPLVARLKEGRRLYSLGYSFVFFAMRCVRRSMEQPRLLGSLAALFGYLSALAKREPIALPPAVVSYLRQEQRGKLLTALRQAALFGKF
jgi:glycosyltransferase involved in cell wall biosynthesis